MKQPKFAAHPQKYKWKLAKREFGLYRRKYKLNFSYSDFRKYLDSLFVYYLNDVGLSVNPDGSSVTKDSAKYMWTNLGKEFAKENLYVWMYQKGGGAFYNLRIGTKRDFDKVVTECLQRK